MATLLSTKLTINKNNLKQKDPNIPNPNELIFFGYKGTCIIVLCIKNKNTQILLPETIDLFFTLESILVILMLIKMLNI
jgi:hypothetical protein